MYKIIDKEEFRSLNIINEILNFLDFKSILNLSLSNRIM